MKNQIKLIATTLLLATTMMANASTLPTAPTVKSFAASLYKIDNKEAVNLFVNKLKGTKLKLEILDQKGVVLYRQVLNKKATKFRTKFNFANLKNAKYTIKLSEGNNVELKTIEI